MTAFLAAVFLYALPLAFGRRAWGVASIAWPIASVLLCIAAHDAWLAVRG